VKEKFTLNVSEAPDLSLALAFESHPCAATERKIESEQRLRESLSGFLTCDARTAWGLTIRQPRYRGEQNESESQERAFQAGKGDEAERQSTSSRESDSKSGQWNRALSSSWPGFVPAIHVSLA
jgi:hypothetical protein